MAGHVTYACSCLNVKIHLANKYYLEGHEPFRKEKFVRLTAALSGWKFGLGIQGVTVEYKHLVRMRHRSEEWITVSCHNCKTGDVYSVQRPHALVEHPIDTSLLSKFGDQVIIHDGTVFGSAIEAVQKNAAYSTTFHVVLNPDLPVNHDTDISLETNTQYKELKQLLKASLIELEEATEKRIQAYQAEQEILLTREKEKAIYDSAILWQTMKEVSKTVQEEHPRTQRLSQHRGSAPPETVRRESIDVALDQQRRQSSTAVRRDLFGHRRPSFLLDEHALSRSHSHLLEPVSEQTPTLSVHPLASPSNSLAFSSSSWKDDDDTPDKDVKDHESDDLFVLDEETLDEKRHSIKYLQSDDEESSKESDTELHVPEIIESNFATSVPIHVPLTKENMTRHSLSIMETELPKRQASFVGFDYAAAADRRLSLNFPPVRRRNTQGRESGQEGPMVPPHILAANNTTNDEAIVGSVPRNNFRHRPSE